MYVNQKDTNIIQEKHLLYMIIKRKDKFRIKNH